MLLAISRNGANENEKTNEQDPDVFCMFKIRHFRIHISEGFVRHIRIELELTLPCRLIFQQGHRDAGAVSIAIRPARDCWTRRFFRCCFLIAWLGSFLFWELRFYESVTCLDNPIFGDQPCRKYAFACVLHFARGIHAATLFVSSCVVCSASLISMRH